MTNLVYLLISISLLTKPFIFSTFILTVTILEIVAIFPMLFWGYVILGMLLFEKFHMTHDSESSHSFD